MSMEDSYIDLKSRIETSLYDLKDIAHKIDYPEKKIKEDLNTILCNVFEDK